MKLLFFIFSILLTTSIFANNLVVLEKYNTVVFKDEFTIESTTKLMAQVSKLTEGKFLNFLIKLGKRPIIYVILDTPGGSIDAGLKAIDFLTALQDKGFEIKTISLFAASMGSHLVEAMGERILTPSGTLMFHKARGGFEGEFGDGKSQLDSRYNYWLRRLLHMEQKVINRTNGKHTLKSFRDLIENEYWCEGEDCIQQGLADTIANVVCGGTLAGEEKVTLKLSYFGMSISVKYTLPNCPIMDVYDVEVTIGEEKVKKNLNDSTISPDLRNFIMKELSPRTVFSKAVNY